MLKVLSRNSNCMNVQRYLSKFSTQWSRVKKHYGSILLLTNYMSYGREKLSNNLWRLQPNKQFRKIQKRRNVNAKQLVNLWKDISITWSSKSWKRHQMKKWNNLKKKDLKIRKKSSRMIMLLSLKTKRLFKMPSEWKNFNRSHMRIKEWKNKS
jgi:hypothetical protein